jgi:hypothetical protein
MSSQLSRRRRGASAGWTLLKSGGRNGLASWRALTDCGMTWRCASSGGTTSAGAGLVVVMMSSSGLSSAPDSSSQSRRSFWATGVVAASASSRVMSEVSRAAVFARIVATPSRRFSSSVRIAGSISWSALTLARSSRTRNAMTWNLVRLVGPTLPFCAFASTSRTLRARIGMMGAASSWRDDWRLPWPRLERPDEPPRVAVRPVERPPDEREPAERPPDDWPKPEYGMLLLSSRSTGRQAGGRWVRAARG